MDGRTTPPPPTARPQPASGKATTQRPREYVTHVPQLCPRLARAASALRPPVKTAAGGGGPERRLGRGKPSVNIDVTAPVASRRRSSAAREGEFSHQCAVDGGALEDVNRAIDPHLTSN